MSAPRCRIATRASPLAVRQAEMVAAELARRCGLRTELARIRTAGDRATDRPLAAAGGKGLFLKELEESLLRGETDLAVHSLKDVPAELPPGLVLAAVGARADPRDAVVAPRARTLDRLPAGARVGTASLRRQAQLRARHPALSFVDLRGNVGTRLARAESGDFDAVVLACAGLERLGLAARITERLEPERCLPAIGQGALAIETAADRADARAWAAALHDPAAAAATAAERAVARGLEADCRSPLAAHAVADAAGRVRLRACLASPDGAVVLRAEAAGPPEDAAAEAVRRLRNQGAAELLERWRGTDAS